MRHDLIMELRGAHTPFALATTGGGAQFIADYLATPGGSATFLEGVVPYAQRATCEYLGFEPESYTSDETARRLASVAMTRAERLDERAFVLGLGATASLASDRPKRGAHRAFCAVQSRWGIYTAALELEKGRRDNDACVYAVGSEGGISPSECELFLSRGFKAVHFNTNILRCETASLYAAAAIQSALDN